MSECYSCLYVLSNPLCSRQNYTCLCFPGYDGVNCQIDIDECLSSPCQNSATCRQRSDSTRAGFDLSAADGYDCDCVTGFTGQRTESILVMSCC